MGIQAVRGIIREAFSISASCPHSQQLWPTVHCGAITKIPMPRQMHSRIHRIAHKTFLCMCTTEHHLYNGRLRRRNLPEKSVSRRWRVVVDASSESLSRNMSSIRAQAAFDITCGSVASVKSIGMHRTSGHNSARNGLLCSESSVPKVPPPPLRYVAPVVAPRDVEPRTIDGVWSGALGVKPLSPPLAKVRCPTFGLSTERTVPATSPKLGSCKEKPMNSRCFVISIA